MKILHALLLGSSFASSLFSFGCSADSIETAGDAVGSVSLALTGQSVSGVTYRLSQATFDISGSADRVLSGDGNASVVSTDLDVGSYSIELISGWKLERSNAGTFTEVAATLTSTNPQSFVISDAAVTQVFFQFRAGDDVVTIGQGNLEVRMNVVDATNEPPLGSLIDDFADGNLQSPRAGYPWQTFSNGGAPAPTITFVSSPLDQALAADFIVPGFMLSGIALPLSEEGLDARSFGGVTITARMANPTGPLMVTLVKQGQNTGYTAPVPVGHAYDTFELPWAMFRDDATGQALTPDALSAVVLMPLQAPVHVEVESIAFF